jgi:hypothetical protein
VETVVAHASIKGNTVKKVMSQPDIGLLLLLLLSLSSSSSYKGTQNLGSGAHVKSNFCYILVE